MRFASRPIFILQSLFLLWTEQGGDDEEWCETKYLIMWQANWKIEMSERHLDGSIQAPRCTSLNNNENPLLRRKLEGVITCRLGWQPGSRRAFTTSTYSLLTAMFVATGQLILCAKTFITEGSSRKPHDELRGPHLYPRKSEEIGLGVFTNPTITAIHISRQSWATKGKYTIQNFFF